MQERADLTIKMAQASGQSAATVSDQLTAVWNNFAKGGENLEHFADVMVRLGADTASSSDEIAEGLQKFASIGETVGLSYDNAAAALATITDRTRESADTVGTALKAIFARIQGLKLGDSLEDGTDLNKYSEALLVVGVSIKDGNGELRAMDDLIDDIGVKWKSLAADEQAALAQTVAGTRLYATFMALMNNYDFYKQNLESALNSAGSLQEQADVYAQSWEAARDRVQAAMEDIYTKLINDEFFIDLSNGFEKVLEGISGFIDGLGGVLGMLTLISSIFMRLFADKMPQVLSSLKENILIAFGQGPKLMAQMQKENQENLKQFQLDPRATQADKMQAEGLKKVSEMQLKYALSSKLMSEEDKNQYLQRLKNIQSIYEEISALEKASEKQKTKNDRLTQRMAYSHRNMAQGEEYLRELFLELEVARQEQLRNAQNKVNLGRTKLKLRKDLYTKLAQKVQELEDYNNNILRVKSNKSEAALKLAAEKEKLEEIRVKIQVDEAELDEAEQKRDELAKPINLLIEVLSPKEIENKIEEYYLTYKKFASMQYELDAVTGLSNKWVSGLNKGASVKDTKQVAISYISSIKKSLKEIEKETGLAFDTTELDKYEKQLEECGDDAEALKKILANFGTKVGGQFDKAAREAGESFEDIDDILRGLGYSNEKMHELLKSAEAESDIFVNKLRAREGSENIPISFEITPLKNSLVIMELGSALMGLQSAYLSVTSAMQVFTDETSTMSDKVGAGISVITSGASALSGITSAASAFKSSALVAGNATKLMATGMSEAAAGAAALAISCIEVLAVIAAIVAIIAIVVKLYKEWEKTTIEYKLKEATKATEELNNELTKAKDNLSEVKTSFDNLKSAKEKLAECKKGTEDWNEALRDNNDQVRELLKKYPQLSSMTLKNANGVLESAISVDENGIMSIADWAENWVVDTMNVQAAKVQMAADMAEDRQAELREREIIEEKEGIFGEKKYATASDPKTSDHYEKGIYLTLSSNPFDDKESITTAKNRLNELAERLGYIIQKDATDRDEDGYSVTNSKTDGRKNVSGEFDVTDAVKNEVYLLIARYGEEAMDHISDDDFLTLSTIAGKAAEDGKDPAEDESFQKILKLIQLELEYRELQKNNEEAALIRNKSTAAQLMSTDANYQKSAYKDNINTIVGVNGFNPQDFSVNDWALGGTKTYSDKNDLIDAYKENLSGNSGEALVKRYLKDAGISNYTDLQLGENGSWSYKAAGEENATTLTAETIAIALASDKVQESAKEYGKTITEVMSKFTSLDLADLFTAGMTGDASVLDPKLLKKSKEEIDEVIDSIELTDEKAKKLGYDSALAFKDQTKSIAEARKAYNQFADNYQKNIAHIIANDEKAAESAQDMADDIEGALDLHVELDNIITPEFVQNNLQLFDDFANGVMGSEAQLRQAIGREMYAKLGLDTKDFDDKWNELNAALRSDGYANIEDIEVGVDINSDSFKEKLADMMNDMIEAGATAEEAGAAIVDSMGIDVETEEDTSKTFNVSTYTDAIPEAVPLPVMANHPVTGFPTPLTYKGVKFNLNPSESKEESTKTVHGVKVKNAKKVKGGNINKTKTATTTNNTGGNRSNNNSTGGSKGGGSSSTPKDNKPAEVKDTPKKEARKEVDRYHEIKEVLEDLSDELDEISKQKDELFGADKLAAMDREKKKLQELVQSHKKYQAEIAKNLNDDKWEAAQIGAIFDENGRITNVQTLQKQFVDEYNATVGALDTSDKLLQLDLANAKNNEDEEGQDAAQKAIDANSEARSDAEDEYQRKRDIIAQYEETLNLDEEAKRQLEDYLRLIRELNYEKLTYKFQIRLELNESDLKDLEQELNRIGESMVYNVAERLGVILAQTKLNAFSVDTYFDKLDEATKLYRLYQSGDMENGIDLAKFISELASIKEEAQNTEQAIRDAVNAVTEELINAFSTANEEFENTFEKIQRRLDFAEWYKDITRIISGETDFFGIEKMINAETGLLKVGLDGLQAQREMWIEKQNDLYVQRMMATSEKEYDEISKALLEVESQIADLDSEILDKISNLAELAEEKFENALEKIKAKAETVLLSKTGLSSLDAMLLHIDNLHTSQELILTTTNQIYETNKLINQAEKDINATTNKRAQQAYQEYINKVKQKQEQNEMTQFELDLLTAEYEITKALIALEEAQNAKDTVRLTRDSEGNYGYVYTANQDKVSDAQQALEDAKNNLYNISKNMLDEMSSAWIENEQAVEEALLELSRDYANGKISAEEYELRQNDIIEAGRAKAELIYKNYYLALGTMTENSYKNEEDYLTQRIQSLGKYDTFVQSIVDGATEAAEDYQEDINYVSGEVSESYGEQKNAIKRVTDATKTYGTDIADLIPVIKTDLTEAIGAATTAWGELLEMLEKVTAAVQQLEKMTHDTLLLEIYKDDYSQEILNRIERGDIDYADYDIQHLLYDRYYGKLYGNDDTDYKALMNELEAQGLKDSPLYILYSWLRLFKMELLDLKADEEKYSGVDRAEKLSTDYHALIKEYFDSNIFARWTDDLVQKWLQIRQAKIDEQGLEGQVESNEELRAWFEEHYPSRFVTASSYDTGGYTGDWGADGKWAMLHEKELVLNADDTANILASVDIIREISRSLDNSALWAMLGMGQLNAATIGSVGGDTLLQQVEIHADFPNVTDHNEIEMAIDNLINAASQYAYRG